MTISQVWLWWLFEGSNNSIGLTHSPCSIASNSSMESWTWRSWTTSGQCYSVPFCLFYHAVGRWMLWFLTYMCWAHFFFLTWWQLNISCNMRWWFIFHFSFYYLHDFYFDCYRNRWLSDTFHFTSIGHVFTLFPSLLFTSFLLCFKDMCFMLTFHTCCILVCVCCFPCFYLVLYMRPYSI